MVRASDPLEVMTDQFKDIGYHFLPDRGICWRLISLALGEFRVIGVPVHIEDSRYPRRAFVFCFCLIVENSREAIALGKVTAQQLAELFYALESETQFLSESHADLHDFLANLRTALNSACDEFVNVSVDHSDRFLQFQKPSLGAPVSEEPTRPICSYFTPISLVDPSLIDHTHECVADVLKACDGWNSVAELSNLLSIDFSQLCRLLHSLTTRQLVAMVDQPIDSFTRVRLTSKFHSFFDDLTNRQEAVAFCVGMGSPGISTPNISHPSEESVDLMPIPNLGDHLVRLYCRLDGHTMDLEEFASLCSSSISARHVVLFGLIKNFLRPKTMFPVYSDFATTMVPVLRLCDGRNSWDDICATFQLTRLEVNEIFVHHGVLKIWK